jgi:hypothetical protein
MRILLLVIMTVIISGCTYDEGYHDAVSCYEQKIEIIQSDINNALFTLDYAAGKEYEYIENAVYEAMEILEGVDVDLDCQ